jgi:hypothetical protein
MATRSWIYPAQTDGGTYRCSHPPPYDHASRPTSHSMSGGVLGSVLIGRRCAHHRAKGAHYYAEAAPAPRSSKTPPSPNQTHPTDPVTTRVREQDRVTTSHSEAKGNVPKSDKDSNTGNPTPLTTTMIQPRKAPQDDRETHEDHRAGTSETPR